MDTHELPFVIAARPTRQIMHIIPYIIIYDYEHNRSDLYEENISAFGMLYDLILTSFMGYCCEISMSKMKSNSNNGTYFTHQLYRYRCQSNLFRGCDWSHLAVTGRYLNLVNINTLKVGIMSVSANFCLCLEASEKAHTQTFNEADICAVSSCIFSMADAFGKATIKTVFAIRKDTLRI